MKISGRSIGKSGKRRFAGLMNVSMTHSESSVIVDN